MAKVETTQEFFRLLSESQLLTRRVLQSVESKLKALGEEVLSSPRKTAGTLVNSQLITAWQARRLLLGKAAGFYVGRYKLMDLIGSGGMGRVYLAEHLRMHQLVAIKVLRPVEGRSRDIEDEIVARFAREAQAIAALDHPNIVKAFDFDDVDGMRYLVMEFVEGVDATTQLMKEGPLHWSQAADYVCQAAAGLQHAHEAGMVHRDVKPANLLVSKSGQVKIVDLGLVSSLPDVTDDAMTVDEYKLGTVDFIAPEQALSSHDVDARADIYSLGGSFYRLASGKLLFPGLNTAQKLLAQQTREPQPITELIPDLPEPLANAVNRMLAKNRDDRFRTAAEVVTAFQPFAKPVSPPYASDIIPHTRAAIEPFLRRGPASFDATLSNAPEAKTVPASQQAASQQSTAAVPANQKSQPAQGLSAPDLVAGDSVVFPVQLSDDSGMTAIRVGRAKKNGRSRGKKRNTGLIVGGCMGVLVIVVIAGLASQVGKAPSPPSNAVSKKTTQPPAAQQAAAAPKPDAPAQDNGGIVIAAVLPYSDDDHNGDGEVDFKDEYVRIANSGSTVADLTGFELGDRTETRHIFPIRSSLRPGESIRILTSDLNFVSRDRPAVWDDFGDRIVLTDANGRELDRQHYSDPGKAIEIIFWPPQDNEK